MATTRRNSEATPRKRQAPAATPEARENQLIALSYDLAEKQIRSGDASSQVISLFLKLGTSREKLEQERLRMEIELGEKKKEVMESAHRVEELMTEAMAAFRSYSGNGSEEEFDD